MGKPGRWRVTFPLIICIFAMGALTRSPEVASIRLVDMLLLFAAGMAAGVALAAFRSTRKTDA